jgi:hypothetical protein
MCDALTAPSKTIIAAGYNPVALCRGLLWSGATLAFDLGGRADAIAELEHIIRSMPSDDAAPSGGWVQ